eukprot:scaffold771_cov387-Prasinococcus_capsulatus_cf.AAC.22
MAPEPSIGHSLLALRSSNKATESMGSSRGTSVLSYALHVLPSAVSRTSYLRSKHGPGRQLYSNLRPACCMQAHGPGPAAGCATPASTPEGTLVSFWQLTSAGSKARGCYRRARERAAARGRSRQKNAVEGVADVDEAGKRRQRGAATTRDSDVLLDVLEAWFACRHGAISALVSLASKRTGHPARAAMACVGATKARGGDVTTPEILSGVS